MPGVATSKTVCADTALSVLGAARRIIWALAAVAAFGDVVGSLAKGGKGRNKSGRVAERVFHGGEDIICSRRNAQDCLVRRAKGSRVAMGTAPCRFEC